MTLSNVRLANLDTTMIACMQSAKHALTRTVQNAIKKNQAATILTAQSVMKVTILITKGSARLLALPILTSIIISLPVFLAPMAHSMIQKKKNAKTALKNARPARMMGNLSFVEAAKLDMF